MRRRTILTSVLLLLLLAALPLAAQETTDASADADDDNRTTSDTEVVVEVGAWGAETDDEQGLVAEYEPTDGGPDLGLLVRSHQPWGHFFFDGRFRDSDDSDAVLEFDAAGRAVRSTTEWTKLLHRLGHDPLTTFAAVTNHGRVLQHTDLDAGADYEIAYELLTHRTEVQFPALPALTVAAGVRNQERHGTRQSIALSHCDTCHVYSQSRRVDQRDTGLSLEAQLTGSVGSIRASVTQRELRQDPTFVTLLYDNALQPELLVPVFDNRLQWDSAQGPQPVDATPDVDKNVVRLDVLLPNLGGFALTGGGVWQETENQFTNLAMDYTGYVATAFRPLGGSSTAGSWDLRWVGRSYEIDNDAVFVDTAEPPGIAGPQAGRTFREIYGFDPDFLRLSSANRDVVESRLDVGWNLPGKKTGRLLFSWDYENVDREYFEVAPNDTETTENVFGVRWRARPAQGWRVDARARHGDVDNPFMALDDQFSTHFGTPAPNPFAPTADQYYVFQDARIGDGTSLPETWDEIRLGVTRTMGNSMVTANYRWWDGDNDSLDLTDWSRTNQAATVTLWMAPQETWDWYLGYAWTDDELDFPTSIPIFDG